MSKFWNYSVEEVEELRERVIIEAKKLLNTPFAHRGRTRFGVDCLGFVYLAYIKAGIPSIACGDGKPYESNWYWFCDKERYLDSLLKYTEFVEEPIKADIVVFRCFKDIVTHGGIYIGNNSFIHAPSGNSPSHRKVRIDNLDHRYWGNKKRFAGFLRFKGFIN